MTENVPKDFDTIDKRLILGMYQAGSTEGGLLERAPNENTELNNL